MENLAAVSDKELISRLEALVCDERELTQKVVRHLAEVEARRLYATLGYTSLYDYACRGLKYSSSAAMRRIRAARAGAKVNRVFDYLETGELNLSTVEVLADLLEDTARPELVDLFRGKSRDEAERIASRFRPLAKRAARDRIKPVVVGTGLELCQGSLFDEGALPSKNLVTSDSVVNNYCEEKFEITFTVGSEFMAKLNRVKELIFRGEKEELELENIFSETLGLYISKHCPKEREKRREDRRIYKEQTQNVQPEAEETLVSGPKLETNPAFNPASTPASSPESTPSRYIPAALRDKVLNRDGCQCTYVSSSGLRCGSTWDLEVDHLKPYALGGETRLENLRVLCQAHNLLAACRHFGRKFVEARAGG